MTDSNGDAQRVFYFAYGSNMSARRFAARVPSAVVICSAMLPGYEIAFHKRGFDGSAKCDAVETGKPDQCIHGVLYALDRSELALLDMAEGRGYGYDRKAVTLRAGATRTLQAECYFATDTAPGWKPFHWYLEHILVGARDARLPAWYIDRFAAIDTAYDHDARRSERELSIYPPEPAD